MAFAGSQYWASNAADIYDSTKNDASGINYSVAYYVNNYVTNLRNAGFIEVQTTGARILKYVKKSDGFIHTDGGYTSSNYGGVRPVIVISTVDL